MRHFAKENNKAQSHNFICVVGWDFLSLFPKIQLGLDQRIAIPSKSYLVNYFQFSI